MEQEAIINMIKAVSLSGIMIKLIKMDGYQAPPVGT